MRNVNPSKRIQEALEGKGMNWTGLLEKTNLSRGALSKHLNRLIDRKIILTRTRDSRPPQTIYYLAKEPFMNLALFLTEGMSEEAVSDLYSKILTDDVFSILVEAHNRIFAFTFGARIPLKDLLSREAGELSNVDWEERGIRFKRVNLLNDLDFEGMSDEEKNVFLGREFSHISVQFVLALYEIEKKIQEILPREGIDFSRFWTLSLIQERDAWQQFQTFSEWWRKRIAPKIPSSHLLAILAFNYVSMNISSPQSADEY